MTTDVCKMLVPSSGDNEELQHISQVISDEYFQIKIIF